MRKQTVQSINYDSVFTPAAGGQAARLEILLKLGLLAYDPASGQDSAGHPKKHKLARTEKDIVYGKVRDANRDRFLCRSWTSGDFNLFRTSLKKAVESTWNNQIILIPPAGRETTDDTLSGLTLNEMKLPGSAWPFLECRLRITFWDPEADAAVQGKAPHGKIFVVMLDRKNAGKQEQSYFDGQPFRPRMTLICDEDVTPRTRTMERKGEAFQRTQIAAAHEVGHWLGQPVPDTDPNRVFLHIDEGKCNQKLVDDCAYGTTKERTQSIMGAGSRALPHDAEPWLQRAREHSGALKGWSFIHHDALKTYLNSGKIS